jgi:AraC-like DNA-binding protein
MSGRDQPIEIVRPMPALAAFVDHLRVLTPIAGQPVERVERLPDGTSTLLFRRSHDAASSAAPTVRAGDLCLAGPRRRALFKAVRPAALTLVIRFKPGGASAFLGVPASEIADRVITLDDLWGAEVERLRERLSVARDPHDMLDVLQDALLARARVVRASESDSARLARHAVSLLRDRETPIRVRALARTLGISDRHLRRAFEAIVGIRPKEFARMVRLQRAIRAARTNTPWTEIAAHAGYYDQAHMIAEFHALIGATPTAFMEHAADRAMRWASPDCRTM